MCLKLHNSSLCFLFSISWLVVSSSALSEPFNVNGFISQGLVKNVDSNFVNDDDDISFDLTEIGINASYQIQPNLRLAGQAVYLNGGNRFDEGVRLDYLLVDWNLYNDQRSQSHLYLGKIKNYHWLYSSTRDVPMTRPSIVLPQSVYFDGTRDMSVGGDGIALSHKYSSEQIGELDFTISSSKADISSDDTRIIIGQHATGSLEHDDDLQASIYWQPHFSPFRFGLALTDAEFSYQQGDNDAHFNGDLALKRWYLNGEYFGEKWTFSAELLQENMKINGVVSPLFYRDTTGQGGFVQSEYKFNHQSQLLMRYERYFADKDDKSGNKLEAATFGLIPHYFGFQHDVTLGFSYTFDWNIKLQLEHHWVDGTARLTPLIIPDPIANPKAHWQLTALQLTHWF